MVGTKCQRLTALQFKCKITMIHYTGFLKTLSRAAPARVSAAIAAVARRTVTG